MKKLFYITFLVALFCKVVEPMLLSMSFEYSADAEQFEVSEAATRTIKIYQPMPYHSNSEATQHVSELYQEGDKFYHVVEQSFQNDTFYIKIQDNMTARERFFALGDAVNDFNFDKEQNNSTENTKSNLSLEDLTKVFSPSVAPSITGEVWNTASQNIAIQHEFLLITPRIALSVPTPPPNSFI